MGFSYSNSSSEIRWRPTLTCMTSKPTFLSSHFSQIPFSVSHCLCLSWVSKHTHTDIILLCVCLFRCLTHTHRHCGRPHLLLYLHVIQPPTPLLWRHRPLQHHYNLAYIKFNVKSKSTLFTFIKHIPDVIMHISSVQAILHEENVKKASN